MTDKTQPTPTTQPTTHTNIEFNADLKLLVKACELSLAREDLLSFIQYMFKSDNKTFVVGTHTRALCTRIDKALTDLFVHGISSYLLVTMPFRHGKALEIRTPIPTPDRGFVPIGELKAGDYVFDEQGQPTMVIATTPIQRQRPCYRVTTDDGHEIIADENHEWVASLDSRSRSKTYTTKYLYDRSERQKKRAGSSAPAVQAPLPVQIPDPKTFVIDPWLFGFWLGDGSSYRADFTVHDDDFPHFRDRVLALGFSIKKRKGSLYAYGVNDGLHPLLSNLGVYGNKHIPEGMMWTSPEYRLALLQGLMDSDGYVAPDGQSEFCSTNYDLAVKTRRLVNSLGYKASLVRGRATLNGVDHGPKYRVMFYMPDSAALPRKRERTREPLRRRRYLKFEEYGLADVVCIQVANESQQYLAGEGFIPTHNSECISRLLTPYIIGKFGSIPTNNPQKIPLETILGCYNLDFASGMSKHAKKYISSSGYHEVFPTVALSKESSAASEWAVDIVDPVTGNRKQIMEFHAAGLLSGVTGKGASILLIDDILKNRDEAESKTYRDKQWNEYTDSFCTRLAPQHLVILCATRWHVDDVLGRVIERNKPESEHYDPDFPIYDVLHYRAKEDNPTGPPTYLFPERFDEAWYKRQFASLGPYSAAALLQGDPVPKGGHFLPSDKIRIIESIPTEILEVSLPVRFWDLASTEKEQAKDDPDSTVGCQGFVFFPNAKANTPKEELRPYFFVTDMRACKLLATSRNTLIVETAVSDGAKIQQGVEAVAGYKDAATTLKTLLKGISTVHQINVRRDKFTRASEMEPAMSAGHVFFVRGLWNVEALTELAQFPSGKHDDYVDAMSGCYKMAYSRALKLLQSGYHGGAGFSSNSHLMVRFNDDLSYNTSPREKSIEEKFEELFCDPVEETISDD